MSAAAPLATNSINGTDSESDGCTRRTDDRPLINGGCYNTGRALSGYLEMPYADDFESLAAGAPFFSGNNKEFAYVESQTLPAVLLRGGGRCHSGRGCHDQHGPDLHRQVVA